MWWCNILFFQEPRGSEMSERRWFCLLALRLALLSNIRQYSAYVGVLYKPAIVIEVYKEKDEVHMKSLEWTIRGA
jgi:hypothetical protein